MIALYHGSKAPWGGGVLRPSRSGEPRQASDYGGFTEATSAPTSAEPTHAQAGGPCYQFGLLALVAVIVYWLAQRRRGVIGSLPKDHRAISQAAASSGLLSLSCKMEACS